MKEANGELSRIMYLIHTGAFIAFDEIAARPDVLEQFQLVPIELNVGGTFYVEEYVRSIYYQTLPLFGVVTFGAVSTNMVEAII